MTDPIPVCRCGHDQVSHRTSLGPCDCRGCLECLTKPLPRRHIGAAAHKYQPCGCGRWEP